MIQSDQELEATKERIQYFQQQVEKLRQVETNPQNYWLSAGRLSGRNRSDESRGERVSFASSK